MSRFFGICGAAREYGKLFKITDIRGIDRTIDGLRNDK
jgi:hypothetical protein